MIRVVVDTNVLVSALLSPLGNPAQVLDHIRNKQITPFVSRELLVEYEEVIRRPKFRFKSHQITGLLELITSVGVPVSPVPKIVARPHQLPDADDEVILMCAFAAEATYLVTGNLRHFPQELCEPVKVVNPIGLLDALRMPQSR